MPTDATGAVSGGGREGHSHLPSTRKGSIGEHSVSSLEPGGAEVPMKIFLSKQAVSSLKAPGLILKREFRLLKGFLEGTLPGLHRGSTERIEGLKNEFDNHIEFLEGLLGFEKEFTGLEEGRSDLEGYLKELKDMKKDLEGLRLSFRETELDVLKKNFVSEEGQESGFTGEEEESIGPLEQALEEFGNSLNLLERVVKKTGEGTEAGKLLKSEAMNKLVQNVKNKYTALESQVEESAAEIEKNARELEAAGKEANSLKEKLGVAEAELEVLKAEKAAVVERNADIVKGAAEVRLAVWADLGGMGYFGLP